MLKKFFDQIKIRKKEGRCSGKWHNGFFVLNEFCALESGGACLQKLLSDYSFHTVLDIGSGSGRHAEIFEKYNKKVSQIDLGKSCYYQEGVPGRNIIIGDYISFLFEEKFDLIWACHVLEHQPNVNLFLKKILKDLKKNGLLAITVPPLKQSIVGGHLSLWNAGLLLYNLVIAGFDCKNAKVLKYGYNISVILEKKEIVLPELNFDKGDIDRLKEFLPNGFEEPFDGDISLLNW